MFNITVPSPSFLPPVHGKPGGIYKANEFDYEVEFRTNSLGLQLASGKSGKNAVVKNITSDYAASHVYKGSLLVSVNDIWLIQKSLQRIENIIVRETAKPPVTLRFRAKKRVRDNAASSVSSFRSFNSRHAPNHSDVSIPVGVYGTLVVKVLQAHDLFYPVTHVSICVDNIVLSTNRVPPDINPVWLETLQWNNWSSLSRNSASINLLQKLNGRKTKLIGRTRLHLPSDFGPLKSQSLEIRDGSGKEIGLLIVDVCLREAKRRIYFIRP